MVISKVLDAELETVVIRMLKEVSENLNSMKKIQSETKDTLIQGCQTQFHQGPHISLAVAFKGPKEFWDYKCNYSLTVKELKLYLAL